MKGFFMLTDYSNKKKSGNTLLPPRLSGSTLKWIALLTMLIDHIGAVLLECGVLQAYSLHLPTSLSYEASYSVFQADLIIRISLDEHPTTKICPGFIFAALRSSSAAIRTSWRSSSNCPAVSISFEIPVALILQPPDLMPEKAADQTG